MLCVQRGIYFNLKGYILVAFASVGGEDSLFNCGGGGSGSGSGERVCVRLRGGINWLLQNERGGGIRQLS